MSAVDPKIPKVLTLYMAAHGEDTDEPIKYSPSIVFDNPSDAFLTKRIQDFNNFIKGTSETRVRMIYAQGCSGIVNKIQYHDGLLDTILETCYKLFRDNQDKPTFTILDVFTRWAKDKKIKTHIPLHVTKAGLRSERYIHKILKDILKKKVNSVEFLSELLLQGEQLQFIKKTVEETDNKCSGIEFQESLSPEKNVDVYYKLLDGIDLLEIVKSMKPTVLDSYEEIMRITEELNKKIRSMKFTVYPKLSKITITPSDFYNVLEKYREYPDNSDHI